MLQIDDLSLNLGSFSLSNLTLDIREGEYIVVLGMSGVGKTVLLEVLAGLLLPERGTVCLDGNDITRSKIQNRPIRLVYQDQALFPHMSVRRNLEFGLRCLKIDRPTIHQTVASLSDNLKIGHLLDRSPGTLSGGEAQRVALGRALATSPRLLLLDEPLSALDPQSRSEIRSLLRTLHRNGQTIIHVTHDYEEAVALASRVVLMEDGTIVQTDTPERVFKHPKTRFVARFVGVRNFIPGKLIASVNGSEEPAAFYKNQTCISIVTEKDSGPGYLMIRSEDITLSNHADETSALNRFLGTITDLVPSASGIEVNMDIGFEISALITRKSLERLSLEIGKEIYASFKATACKFIGEG